MLNHKCLTLLGPATYLTFFFSMRKTKSQTFYHRKRERAQTTICCIMYGLRTIVLTVAGYEQG